jgi:hypothetical protein
MTEKFEEIKNAFQDNCSECRLIDQKIAIIVEFKNKEDAEWFESNIVYPKGNMEKSPVKHVMKMSEESKKFAKPFFNYTYTFEVKNKDQLMDKLNKK